MERKANNHHSLTTFINLADHLQIVYRDACTLWEKMRAIAVRNCHEVPAMLLSITDA